MQCIVDIFTVVRHLKVTTMSEAWFCHLCKTVSCFCCQSFLPFQSIYCTAVDQVSCQLQATCRVSPSAWSPPSRAHCASSGVAAFKNFPYHSSCRTRYIILTVKTPRDQSVGRACPYQQTHRLLVVFICTVPTRVAVIVRLIGQFWCNGNSLKTIRKQQ